MESNALHTELATEARMKKYEVQYLVPQIKFVLANNEEEAREKMLVWLEVEQHSQPWLFRPDGKELIYKVFCDTN